jgi:hypothetical protein
MGDSQFISTNQPNISSDNNTIFDYNESYFDYYYVYDDVTFWQVCMIYYFRNKSNAMKYLTF